MRFLVYNRLCNAGEMMKYVAVELSEQIIEARRLVDDFFGGDLSKTKLWFETPNPLLGGITPLWLINNGRTHRLLEFIKTQLSENER